MLPYGLGQNVKFKKNTLDNSPAAETGTILEIIPVHIKNPPVIQFIAYLEKITDKPFPIFVLEKPNVNTLEEVTKDGIHIVVGIHLHHEAQMALRELMLDEIDNVLCELPLQNDYDSVIDKGIVESEGKHEQILKSSNFLEVLILLNISEAWSYLPLLNL